MRASAFCGESLHAMRVDIFGLHLSTINRALVATIRRPDSMVMAPEIARAAYSPRLILKLANIKSDRSLNPPMT